MIKKKVYLAQPSDNKQQNKSIFLPYSAGCLAAYAFERSDIREVFEFCGFIYVKETIEKSMELIENPSLVGFSCYMWNVEYNLALAKAVKEKYPEAVISFGGPQIPDDTEYLEKYDFIDVVTHGEGEVVLYELLSAIAGGRSFADINNITYRDGDKIITNGRSHSCALTSFPSPYTAGYFDYIVNDPKLAGTQFDTVLETNRGCPFGCIYCYFGRNGERMRLFPIEKVKAELLWMAEKKVSYCICADSNFGMFERDEEIADYLVELKLKYGYPERFETASGKNKNDLVFRIYQKFEKAGLNKGISVAVQSMSPEVLKIIGRKNMTFEELANELKRYRDNNIFTYTDLILGLPGETFDSFCEGLFKVIEAGQHNAINIFRLELLPNTPLYSKDVIEKYKFKTIKSNFCQSHASVADASLIGSRSELIVGTSTMSPGEWKDAERISTMVLSFHCMGLLRFIAIYLRKSMNISYKEFYTHIFNKTKSEDNIVCSLLDGIFYCIDDFLEGKSNLEYTNPKFGDIYWPFEEALFLNCADNLDEFYRSISEILQIYTDDALEDLIRYQKEIIYLPSMPSRSVKFKYDWPMYFKDIYDESLIHPERRDIVINFSKSHIDNFADYSREIVWFGKRSDKMIVKDFTVEYQ